MPMMCRGRCLLPLVCALLALAVPAVAQWDGSADEIPFPVGLRVGYTSWESARQVHFGGQADLGEFIENLSFVPSVELGLGDNLTVVAINGDVRWAFTEMVGDPWGLYGGGSLGLIWTDWPDADANTDLGLSVLGGLTRRFANGHDGLLEVRLGLLDSPGCKVTFGYSLF
jgi:hypothetical protein